MNIFLGIITPLIIYLGITILHLIIPVKRMKGYVKDEKTGEVLNYRINGKFVLVAGILIWFWLGFFNFVPFAWLHETRWWGLIGAVVIGLAYTFFIVLKHKSSGKPFIADLWLGRSKDPQIKNGLIDAKVWLYLIGAVMLMLNVLSSMAYHINLTSSASYNLTVDVSNVNIGFLFACGMLTWFCFDYLIFEKVHLWTYDFIAERVGFKLGFGCLAFYPFFYSVPVWAAAHLANPGWPIWVTILIGVLFLFGWTLTRGANMQKYFFKTKPDKKFLFIKPQVLSDGKHSLLVNGFWGKSRHINYLGEIIQALAIAIVIGFPEAIAWLALLYPAYYIFLMVTRQIDDNKICKKKYGELWDQYTKKVKYRIIPFIY